MQIVRHWFAAEFCTSIVTDHKGRWNQGLGFATNFAGLVQMEQKGTRLTQRDGGQSRCGASKVNTPLGKSDTN